MVPEWIKYIADICKYSGSGLLVSSSGLIFKIAKGEVSYEGLLTIEFLIPFGAACLLLE